MKHKTFSFLLALLMSMAANVASAHDFAMLGNYSIYFSITSSTNLTVAVTYRGDSPLSYSDEYSGSVTIPESVTYNGKTYSVTSIGSYAFKWCSSLTSVTIPNSVTSIGSSAFEGCTGLTSVTIPNSVTYIGSYAFRNCTGLTSVTIGNSVTSIGSSAFYGCTGLTSVTIGNSVTSIGSSAFYGCTKLTSVTIPESVTSIGGSAFYNTAWYSNQPDGLVYAGKVAYKYKGTMPDNTEIVLKEGTLGIAVSAFSSCTKLTSVTIPESVTSIGDYAFSGCTGLTKAEFTSIEHYLSGISFSGGFGSDSNPLYIAHHLYVGGNEVTNLVIPNSVTSIGGSAFYGCTGLTSVTIPNSVTSIGSSAFYGLTKLKSVSIPNSVTSIGNYAFSGCTGLTKAEFTSIEHYLSGISFSGGFGSDSNPLYIAHHLYVGGNEVTNLVIPNSVTSIGGSAFYGCTGLTSVTIPNSVTSIGSSAFSGCTKLTSVTINSNDIASKTYTSSSTLASIFGTQVTNYTFGGDVKKIGDYVCYKSTGLTSVTIPESVTSIGNYIFYGCTGLTSVTIPNSVTSIESSAFRNCTGLTSVTIPNSVTSIGSSAFEGCTGLTSVTIGNSVTYIGSYAFSGCTGLTSVTIPNSVTSIIGSSAFPSTALLYVKRGTTSLLSLWEAGYVPYEVGTSNKLQPTRYTVISTTQTTATVNVENVYKDFQTTWNDGSKVTEGEQKLTGLRPRYSFDRRIYVSNDVKEYRYSLTITTQPISPSIVLRQKTASSLSVVGSYIEGDAEVSQQRVCIDGTWIEANSGKLTGLNPNRSVKVKFSITAAGYTYTSSEVTLTTEALTLETQQPKVITEGNIIVAATSNLDDEEQNVGFQWRRQDWNDDFDSKEGGAYLYDGQMEGYIRSLNANYLWKFRPYYEANDGTRYYGEWKGMDPSDFSYFDPTVHTYAKIAVNGNMATVRGYAQRGTDNIVSQGFKYWQASAGVKGEAHYAPSVPSTAQTMEATGTVMEVDLTGLDYETTYHYVAYVTTSEGETFYGEEQTFTTGGDPTGIESLPATESAEKTEATEVYDLSGRRLPKMQRGINIVRMSNGTTRKVMVK